MSLARLHDLSPEQARVISELLDEVLSVEPAARASWQRELERRQPEWSTLIGRLLEDIPEATEITYSDDSIACAVSQAVWQDGVEAGQMFGPYRLARMLGRGGMGTVWLAERADGLFQRKVALKLPHRNLIDSGARERFARERDILARLTHPGIARLLDAGFSPHGYPYLALDFVEGRTLDQHCDEERLGLRERLELMLQVLSAVQFAHQNLVIHRDIKPGNVLVTAGGEARLLDFGISKLMLEGAEAAHDSELTQLAGRALTPDYASPEQLAGEPVSTLSDVYSLGVVLYGLLCGHKPFSRLASDRRVAAGDRSLLRPSQRLATAQIAQARSTTPSRLARMLTGDLDMIVLKALRDDPSERYPTAEALREDIARYLDGEPVTARADGLGYRAWKFVKRHRFAVAATAVVATLLLGATEFSMQKAKLARAAAAQATREAERARAVQDFLLSVFMSNSDQQLDPLAARQRTARELLDVGSARVVSQLKAAPEALADLCDPLADMYHQMGLGADAARMRGARIAALKKVHGRDHELIAEAYLLQSQDYRLASDLHATLASLDQAKLTLDRLGDAQSQTRAFVWLEAAQTEQYTSLDAMREDAERARAYFTAHTVERMWSNRYKSVDIEGRAYFLLGELERAERGHIAALRELEQLGLQATAWSVTSLVWLAESQWQASQLDAAQANLREALALSLFFNGTDAGATLQTQTKLGALLHQTGQRAQGLALLRDVEGRLPRSDARALAMFRSYYAAALLAEGRAADAQPLVAALVDELQHSAPKSLPMARALLLRSTSARMRGELVNAVEDAALALQLWTAGAGRHARPGTFYPYLLTQARALLALGDVAGARRSLDMLAHDQTDTADVVEGLVVRAHANMSEPGQAQLLAQGALGLLRAPLLLGRLPRLEAEALLRLGEARVLLGDAEQACTAFSQAATLFRFTDSPASPWLSKVPTAAASCSR